MGAFLKKWKKFIYISKKMRKNNNIVFSIKCIFKRNKIKILTDYSRSYF